MRISHDIRAEHGDGVVATEVDAEAGMRAKSREFAASGNRVYLPLAD